MADPGEARGLLGGAPAAAVRTVGEPLPAATGTPEEAAGTVVHYHFPVEIEVRAAPEAADPETAARLALQWLAQGLRSL
jgi:hypothetical protein